MASETNVLFWITGRLRKGRPHHEIKAELAKKGYDPNVIESLFRHPNVVNEIKRSGFIKGLEKEAGFLGGLKKSFEPKDIIIILIIIAIIGGGVYGFLNRGAIYGLFGKESPYLYGTTLLIRDSNFSAEMISASETAYSINIPLKGMPPGSSVKLLLNARTSPVTSPGKQPIIQEWTNLGPETLEELGTKYYSLLFSNLSETMSDEERLNYYADINRTYVYDFEGVVVGQPETLTRTRLSLTDIDYYLFQQPILLFSESARLGVDYAFLNYSTEGRKVIQAIVPVNEELTPMELQVYSNNVLQETIELEPEEYKTFELTLPYSPSINVELRAFEPGLRIWPIDIKTLQVVVE